MEFSSVRPFLQGLCYNCPWNYAVFWKLMHQYETMLVWEDGFCDVSKSRLPMGDPIEDCDLENSNKVASHIGLPVLDGLDGASSEYPIELAVTEMSSASHLVGEGVVGRAALEGVAQWIYPDNMTTDTLLDSECPDEWLLQFAAGIKTILLLPVIPNGVLQLGSVEMVPEDLSFVAYVIDKYEAHRKSAGRNPEYSIQHFNLVAGFMENKDESLTSDSKKVNELQKGTNTVKTNECMVPLLTLQDLYNSSIREFTDTPENVIDSWHPLGTFHAADTCQLSCENDFTVTQNTIPKSLHLDENERPFPYVYNSNCAVYGDFVHKLMGFSCEESAFEQIFVGNDFDNAICEDESNFASFVTESDLQKALESAGVGDLSHYVYDSSISNQNTDCNLHYDNDLFYGEDISGFESAGFLFGEDEMNHLLEAVVSNSPRSSFDNNNSEHSSLTTINMSSKGHLDSSKRTSQPKCSVTSAFVVPERKNVSNLSAQISSVESKYNTNRQQKRKRKDSLNPENVSRLSKTSKRMVSNGDNQRTKPRDRKMIQDRIKELRDLIPNSEKCSIDGLLDKTIKHMDFLRRATDQADKLRLENLKEETDENIPKQVEATTRGNQKGTSWAVELGADQQSCPIIVKDLDHPGHMLIEMLCANHDRFLEIADVIHRLQLTILKGLMEEKPDKSWARFIVQASGNFHRLDIFWPLMQLM